MNFQDIVFSVGQWILIFALLPSVFGKDKPALVSSIITGSVLMVFAFTYATLSFWISFFSAFIVSSLWFVLAIQKYLIERRK